MTSFNRSTNRRLKKLNQIPSVWEGDRRPLSSSPPYFQDGENSQGDCIVWVDGSQGIVRAMDVVASSQGPEAVVRTLMRAIEHPHSPAKPATPQKIVVRDREIQFYLRGVLQDLDIHIEYAPQLPLIDELFRSFSDTVSEQVPDLPPKYAKVITEKAYTIWEAEPWNFLEEQQIISIEINKWDVETLYASVMGMMGMEYGILFYRSQDSLKEFRSELMASNDESKEALEELFLKQDCLFLSFDKFGSEEEDENLADLPISEIEATFGNIHPLEGLRSTLYEEDALVTLVGMESLLRFIRDFRHQLYDENFPPIQKRYRISLPPSQDDSKSVTVTVATMPELATELEEIVGWDFDEDEDEDYSGIETLRDDLIPDNSLLNLGLLSWDVLEQIRKNVKHHTGVEIIQSGEGLPVILIQTSRPKGKTVIDKIQSAGGLKAVCFNPGANPLEGEEYDLGLLQTENGELYLFGEFPAEDPTHIEARKKWNQRCEQTDGYCGVIIAQGLTGAGRGNPRLKEMMALFEVPFISSEDLNLGTLQLMPEFLS